MCYTISALSVDLKPLIIMEIHRKTNGFFYFLRHLPDGGGRVMLTDCLAVYKRNQTMHVYNPRTGQVEAGKSREYM